MHDVRYARGIHLPAEGLWLDPSRRQTLAFVSHAHSDHAGRHEATIATPETLELMQARMGRLSGELHPLAFGEEKKWEDFSIRLLPAGHILGSAQCLIQSAAGSLLYTGDFKLRKGMTTGAAESLTADTLIMETTFGLPRYIFPPAEAVIANILGFCRQAMEDRAVPVLLAYSLGKAQEVLAALSCAGIPAMPHKSIAALLPAYERAGFVFSGCRTWDPEQAGECVVICPPSAIRSLATIPRRRTAAITGWAIDSSTVYRMKCDAAFPLSDHAGYDDLLAHVENVSPKRVFTLHGYASEFARDLRALGIEAWSLLGADQLDLPL
ncbi:MAG: MBL fold metallo-hydrolase [Terrimicrobiaceae bacterium]